MKYTPGTISIFVRSEDTAVDVRRFVVPHTFIHNTNHSPHIDKWNESGFRPPLCTYRLNWARRTSWGWWDDWDDTVLQTQDSKFEPWRSEAEHATSRSRRLPTILTFTRGCGRNILVSFKPPRPGTEPRTLAWKAAVLTTTLGPPPTTHRYRSGQPPLSQIRITLIKTLSHIILHVLHQKNHNTNCSFNTRKTHITHIINIRPTNRHIPDLTRCTHYTSYGHYGLQYT